MQAVSLRTRWAAGSSQQAQQQRQQQRSGPTAVRSGSSRRLAPPCAAQQGGGGGFGEAAKRFAKQVQGGLPVIGLISRWASTEGGVGNDAQAYPEYSRQLFDAAPQGFQIAVAELQNRHGKAAQRRYVLLALWMARNGCGALPGKVIVDAARRLRISQDLEYEMDRFADALQEATAKFTYMEADVAVDALARLVLGLKDGQPVPAEDAALLEECVEGGFWDVPGMREEARRALAEREQRATAYV